jgi:hypothetical protein
MQHVIQFSGGLSSWKAAKRVAAEHGTDDLRLLFTDTFAEDFDLYRFLIEGAADVFGMLTPAIRALAATAKDIPPEREDTLEARKAAIKALRAEAIVAIPKLIWLYDGRTPWEVFFDERFMGNSRADPCSRVLKRELSDRWRRQNCDPADTTIYLGYGYDEQKRIRGILKRLGACWKIGFPMDSAPYMNRLALMADCREHGIEVPRIYLMGMKHNNCGGRCVKGGQASWRKTLQHLPELFAYDERQEERFRQTVKIDSSILTDRRGGTGKKRFTLKQFREQIEAGGGCDNLDWGSCSCFDLDEDAEAEEDELLAV